MKAKVPLLLLVPLFLLSGCVRYYYAPNQHNVPLFKEKNEARLSGTMSMGADASGFEVQAAYAPTKGLGLIGNACVFKETGYAKGHLYELGAGYYKPIPSQLPRVSEKFIFEVYGVGGLGSSRNYFSKEGPAYASINFFKGYLQPSIGFTHDIVDVLVSTKFGALHVYDTHRDLDTFIHDDYDYDVYTPLELEDDFKIINTHRTGFLCEPSFTVRVGYKYVKFQYQMGWSFLTNDLQDLNSNFNLNFGLVLSLAPRFWAKKEEKK